MSTPVMKIGNAEKDSEGNEFLSSEPWTKMVSAPYLYTLYADTCRCGADLQLKY